MDIYGQHYWKKKHFNLFDLLIEGLDNENFVINRTKYSK
jgi:hypothetical protein